tara:strand:- start:2108 stop:3424 length:1317 start_codon:yes stop_codon:yes gene_type:complete
MKLLFIENRHKTYFFEAIANQLANKGYDIYWLTQNKQFSPSNRFKNFIIEYPSGDLKGYRKDEGVEDIIESDRQVNYFNKTNTSYFYYYNNKIEKYLNELKPDFVFGESTAFHELLVIYNCKKLNILYLNPSTSRFPVGRFSFYKYNTLEPYRGSKEQLEKEKAIEAINQVVGREIVPDYMKSISVSSKSKVRDKVLKIYSYFRGEKFNTPHPSLKYKIEQQKKKIIELWDQNAEMEIKESSFFKILYPLQMQPEANIDVWGKKYRNQQNLIQETYEALPKKTVLYIKPNPKSNYELTEELISYVAQQENIKILHHSVKMNAVLPKIDLVITVTGTIAIECILSNKPVVTLIKTINNLAENCIYIEDLKEDLKNIISLVEMKEFKILNEQEKIVFINILNSTSYRGKVSDPFTDKTSVSKENINDLVIAFDTVIETNE